MGGELLRRRFGAAAIAAAAAGCPTPPAPSAPRAGDPPVVVEAVDRSSRPAGRAGRLVDGAVVALTGTAVALDGWSEVVGDRDRCALVLGVGEAAPDGGLVDSVRSRLRVVLGGEPAKTLAPGVGAVVAASPVIRAGRFDGVTSLVPDDRAPVVLAILDLGNVVERDGGAWSWKAGTVLVGRDPAAVDRVALRILDSARRATGAAALETDDRVGDPRLADAAGRLGGEAGLDAIRWLKVPVIE